MGKLVDVKYVKISDTRTVKRYIYECSVCGCNVEYHSNHNEEFAVSICRDCKAKKSKLRNENYKKKREYEIKQSVIDELCQPHNLEIMLTKTSAKELKDFIQNIL